MSPVKAPGRRRAALAAALLLVAAVPAAGRLPARAPTPGVVGPPLPAPGVAPARVSRDPSLRPLRRGDLSGAALALPLEVAGAPTRLALTAVPVLPGGRVDLRLPGAPGAALIYQDGAADPLGDDGWRWTAPEEPGAYALRVADGERVAHVTAFVLHPAAHVRGGALHGYAIGEYLSRPLRGDPAYLPPVGFAQVEAEARDLLVSPRLTLGQLLCKQPGEPRFVALSPALLDKLERLMDRVARAGRSPEALVVMSGFRTPAYNRAIGNTTSYSRHLWGDAADVYLDEDGDGEMDDLDGDGRVDVRDARVLAAWVEEVARTPGVRPGGLSVYRRNAVHGPFVHVDARGTRARW